MSAFSRALAHVFAEEGGWSDHPEDPGGQTMYGITAVTLAEARKWDTDLPMRVGDLTKPQAAAIYRKHYWDAVEGDVMPAWLALPVFDAAVNHGPDKAVRMLQQALGVSADGVIGPVTRAAIKDAMPDGLLSELHAVRAYEYGTRRHFGTFGRGWMRRLMRTYREALRAWVHA